MSIYKDYISNYYQAIQKYKDSINRQTIKQNINDVLSFVREHDHDPNELLDFHNKQKILESESYKYDVFDKAHEALCLEMWNASDIGSGLICNRVADAMAYTDNLVNRHFAVPKFLKLLDTSDKQKIEKYEHTFYEIYLGDDEEKAFTDAKSCFSGTYPLIAYLFFIKDRDRFLPTSPDTFDAIFKEMGIGFSMSQRCGWENYCNFIAIFSCVKDYISDSGLCEHEVSLLDAHSAVWIMNYPEYEAWHRETKDINTPMRPKKKIRKADGTISYQCGRCDYSFRQSERCPECGQLVKS